MMATCFYFAGFDVSLLTLGTMTIATAGESNAVVTLNGITGTAGDSSTSSLYSHTIGLSTIVGDDPDATARFQNWNANSFDTDLQTAMRAAATTASWATPNGLSASYDSGTGLYTLGYTTTFSLTFSVAAGRNLLGYSGTQSGGSSYLSDQTPTYVVAPTLTNGVSEPTSNYEPGNIASRATADDGTGYGISRTTSPLYRDWIQQYETRAKTLRLDVASTHPWSFQHLFEHCRTVYPVIVINGGFNDAFPYLAGYLREDGVQFKPERATPGNDLQWHIPFKIHVEGHDPP